jgi:hypothetical protein
MRRPRAVSALAASVIAVAASILAVLHAGVTGRAHAETIGGNPGPAHNYVCPHADGGPALDCYFDAVQHLYTMCRDVKAIEIIEFGYAKSTDGTNGAKSDYCLDKQKQNIIRPYKAALKQVSKSHPAVSDLERLQQMWVVALANLQWRTDDSDAEYKSRVIQPYEEFKDRIAQIRTEWIDTESQRTPVPASHRVRAEVAHRARLPQLPAKAKSTSKATSKPASEPKAQTN